MKNLISITSYKKPSALRELLNTMKEHKYLDTCDVLICDDDNEQTAKEVAEEFKTLYTCNLTTTGSIARNKNRGIKYFLENNKYENLILLDDDLLFTKEGLVEELIACNWPHITGYLGTYTPGVGIVAEERKQFSGNSFFEDFKPIGQTGDDGVVFCPGAQGIMLFLTREMAEKCMYFHIPPGRYGYEHSIYSNVINKILGYQIDHFPIFIRTPVYLIGNYNYPNQYEAKPELNNRWWINKKLDITRGLSYINKNHGISDKEEVICF